MTCWEWHLYQRPEGTDSDNAYYYDTLGQFGHYIPEVPKLTGVWHPHCYDDPSGKRLPTTAKLYIQHLSKCSFEAHRQGQFRMVRNEMRFRHRYKLGSSDLLRTHSWQLRKTNDFPLWMSWSSAYPRFFWRSVVYRSPVWMLKKRFYVSTRLSRWIWGC